ncbi:DNA repair protein XRCC1 isoform X2 [Microcaecilia unicolor]|uniref:DNA repair protein XRCC1 isoform X2 n=1 Tax=Microcaecilia unicolor TaxID=1415580 RepID=A0A6P7YRV4_9AMPH|nr:DNA repair protein XRCC1 isoform X2 [Microcaecilia unicolor]
MSVLHLWRCWWDIPLLSVSRIMRFLLWIRTLTCYHGLSRGEGMVILVTSSFMSPTESKNSSNSNRVRMFGPEKLVKGTAEKKWDRVKIVCTQPYNKNLSYGLSFIRFHSPPDPGEAQPAASSASTPRVTKLGQFVVKEEESNSSGMKPGSLFFNRSAKSPLFSPKASQNNDQPAPSYAAATLRASSAGEPGLLTGTPEKPSAKTPSPKESTLVKKKFEFSKESQVTSSAKKSVSKEQAKASPRPKESPTEQPASKKMKATPPSVPSSTAGRDPAVSPATITAEKVPAKKKQKKPAEAVELQQILQGTVFVLSGFQNPFRAQLRDKALEMGAKYQPDWTSDCTHLICAFLNTPKYSQVKAMGGTVVKKEWILDCHKRKQRLSHKRYLMYGPQSSSEEEGNDEEDAPSQKQNENTLCSSHGTEEDDLISEKPPRTPDLVSDEEMPGTSRSQHEEDFSGSTDEDVPEQHESKEEDSGGDTEDELRRIVDINQKKQTSLSKTTADDPYGGSTDENTDVEEEDEDLPIPELPDFFLGKHFLLYGDFPPAERRMLSRYIIAFNGELEEYMNEKVNYVVTMQDWDDTFEEALVENANLSFVKPRWIYTCNERQKLIPHQPFVVVPQT